MKLTPMEILALSCEVEGLESEGHKIRRLAEKIIKTVTANCAVDETDAEMLDHAIREVLGIDKPGPMRQYTIAAIAKAQLNKVRLDQSLKELVDDYDNGMARSVCGIPMGDMIRLAKDMGALNPPKFQKDLFGKKNYPRYDEEEDDDDLRDMNGNKHDLMPNPDNPPVTLDETDLEDLGFDEKTRSMLENGEYDPDIIVERAESVRCTPKS